VDVKAAVPSIAHRLAPQLGAGLVWMMRDTLPIAERSEYQTDLTAVRDQFDERVKAVRHRKDKERAKKNGGSM
jgi:hypothetical protein